MKLSLNPRRSSPRAERAFTLVEIVLSLAIIAIAMIAIIGVIPIGLNVQTENQEESIISTDAAIWMEAFRNGAQGAAYFNPGPVPGPLFNIDEVRVQRVVRNTSTGAPLGNTTTYRDQFTTNNHLIGLLSRPKYQFDQVAGTYTNWNVYADVRAFNGNLADLSADMDFAFKYRMTPELVPVSGRHPAHLQNTNGPGPFPQALPILETNLFELRLNFQWPLIVGAGGDYRAQTRFAKSLTFRTLVSGQQLTRINDQTGELLYFMAPRQYSYSTSQLTNPPLPNPQPYSP